MTTASTTHCSLCRGPLTIVNNAWHHCTLDPNTRPNCPMEGQTFNRTATPPSIEGVTFVADLMEKIADIAHLAMQPDGGPVPTLTADEAGLIYRMLRIWQAHLIQYLRESMGDSWDDLVGVPAG